MGDFAVDTAIEGDAGHYRATLSRDWEIWGPNGGYVAAIALRAAGAESRFARPASFSAQFLSSARFEEVEGGTQFTYALEHDEGRKAAERALDDPRTLVEAFVRRMHEDRD